jgi:hypothetical protein
MTTKKVLVLFAVGVIIMLAIVNLRTNTQKGSLDVALYNVEALSNNECTQGIWVREDGDCVYRFEGKAGSKITILGVTLTFNAEGYVTYTISAGKTNCSSGGTEQCTARYCSSIIK